MANNKLKYTCMFGGGAIRGVAYIGTIKALEELGIVSDTYAGSSVGSIFASLLAVGYTSDELKQIFAKVNFELFKDIALGFGPIIALSKGELFLEWVRELIEKKFYGEKYQKGENKAVTFSDLDKNLVIITTNLSNFECKEFSKFETPDYEIASAVRISCCMPGLMKPIEYNKTLLVDGDLQKSWPMWKLSNNLADSDDRLLEFRLEGDYNSNNISGIDYANAVYSCMTSMATSFVTHIYANKDKFDYIVLNTGKTVVVDLNLNEAKRNELIQSGYEQTMNYFKLELPTKKAKIKKYYEIIKSHFNKIQKFLDANKIFKVKIQLGDLYMDLCEFKNIIDLKDINEINKFKEIFNSNIKYPALFGKIKLNNENLIKAQLAKVNNNLNFKLNDIENYLKLYSLK
jgi:NTE family protein